jgi:hypothetical protein
MNGMKLVSGLPEGYQQQDVKEVLRVLKDAVQSLDTLGQIQAAVGGLSMSSKSNDTFEIQAKLENFIAIIEAGTQNGYQFYTDNSKGDIVAIFPKGQYASVSPQGNKAILTGYKE